jgi:membrane associated rhomboid family serine protease
MEINHLLLFAAIASSALVLARGLVRPHATPWLAALTVLLASIGARLFFPQIAGFAAAAVWAALLLAPAWKRRRAFRPAERRRRQLRLTPAVAALLIANAATFLIEVARGGSTNPGVLHTLGELDPWAVLVLGQYWRLGAALFLHFGFAHLALNLAGLYIVGLPLETETGPWRFLACYFFSGIMSGVTVVWLTRLRLLPPMELVGASGAVMGVVGGWIGLLIRNREDHFAAQRLRSLILLVFIQVIFDLLTPRVSLPAHVAGLLAGILFGLLFAKPLRQNACRY